MPAWLFALLLAVFVLYTDDYVIAGILPELALGLGVTEAQAGQLVTVFSLTVAVAASGAPAGRTGRYVALVSLGVTGSIAAGVPLGTWIGGQFGWRATFAVMAGAGIVALLLLQLTLPRHTRPTAAPRLIEQVRVLARASIALGLLANCVLMTASMMMLTYLAPYLAAATTAGIEERALAFSLAGAAGIAGLWAGGEVTDRWGPDRTLVVGVGVFITTMLGLWLLWGIGPSPFPVVAAVGAIWGGAAFWNSPAIQARLYRLAGPSAPQALALNTSATYRPWPPVSACWP